MWRIMKENFRVDSCKSCVFNKEKKKKDIVKQRIDILPISGKEVEYQISEYKNRACDWGFDLKFGVIDCPMYSKDLGMVND